MYRVRASSDYKRSIKKLSRSGSFDLTEVNKVIDMLIDGKSLPLKYRNHKLIGEYTGCFECHIRPNLLLIYQIQNKELVLVLIDIGSHSYLFN